MSERCRVRNANGESADGTQRRGGGRGRRSKADAAHGGTGGRRGEGERERETGSRGIITFAKREDFPPPLASAPGDCKGGKRQWRAPPARSSEPRGPPRDARGGRKPGADARPSHPRTAAAAAAAAPHRRPNHRATGAPLPALMDRNGDPVRQNVTFEAFTFHLSLSERRRATFPPGVKPTVDCPLIVIGRGGAANRLITSEYELQRPAVDFFRSSDPERKDGVCWGNLEPEGRWKKKRKGTEKEKFDWRFLIRKRFPRCNFSPFSLSLSLSGTHTLNSLLSSLGYGS